MRMRERQGISSSSSSSRSSSSTLFPYFPLLLEYYDDCLKRSAGGEQSQ